MYVSHGVKPFGRGPTTLKELRSPWLLTTYKSWDDPPSTGLKVRVKKLRLG